METADDVFGRNNFKSQSWLGNTVVYREFQEAVLTSIMTVDSSIDNFHFE